ncbi:tRNA (adenosine(37)-N6)-threonylcarbamoyltransferase complex dimerization subunit type 1 TsaB [Pseudorhodobacter sp. W20_MBD10_FR17]|uniref:tRNA (adenosine(37)-N6)-threonylcarbamoyltransferase complex dimerization subunit type 1 TsaB n=1 Tax=Pseudorhodobacter sp. W20_MBD10_FR17 TaxID=3240266 RepID=UPI003F9A52DD
MPPKAFSDDTPLLAFDTSAAHCAAALLLHGKIIAEAREEMAKGQAERLMPLIEEMLVKARLTWRDLGAIAVGVGPGNFTGIRISVAAARGLALGLGVPAVGVTGPEALAQYGEGAICVATPSSRGALYLQEFDGGSPSTEMREAHPDVAGFWPEPKRQLIGDWPETDRTVLRPDPIARVRAIAIIGATRAAQNPSPPAPFYLRAADAAPPSDPPPVILDPLS